MCIRGCSLCCLSALLLFVGISQAKEPKPKKNVDVSVEVKFVEVDASVTEELKQQGLLGQQSKGKDGPLLDFVQMIRFLEVIQGDVRSNVMQVPMLTMRDGQTAAIDPLDEQRCVTGIVDPENWTAD